MFARVLVANRGEIAVRILATLRRMGIEGVAVAGPEDLDAPHTRAADCVVRLEEDGGYLSVERIVDAARRSGAEAVHPGYGFLSESPALAEACRAAGLVFIGPPPEAMAVLGNKIAAKQAAAAVGVDTVPGFSSRGASDAELRRAAVGLSFPLLVKAAAGGGGRGMRTVTCAEELPAALTAARREAAAAFGDDAVFLERLVDRPRHVEVQVLADDAGTVWALTERECTLQRRHQKIVEESPSPAVHPNVRERLLVAARAMARSSGYRNAGTIEFLLPGEAAGKSDATFFFLEVNTRLQVEHPVSEAVHGLDLVSWQVRIAAGEQLPSEPPAARGHAVEARVYAEDPGRDFLPTGGRIRVYREPDLEGVRVDSGVAAGALVSTSFDPLIAKVVASADERTDALRRLRAGLGAFATLGVDTNVAYLRALLAHPAVVDAEVDTGLVARAHADLRAAADDPALAGLVPVVAALAWLQRQQRSWHAVPAPPGWRLRRQAPTRLEQRIGDRRCRVTVSGDVHAARIRVEETGTGPASQEDARPTRGDDAHPIRRAGSVTASARRLGPGRLAVTVEGIERTWDVADEGAVLHVGHAGHAWTVEEAVDVDAAASGGGPAGGPVTSPMPGTVTAVEAGAGDSVVGGQRLVVVEAMKMEHPVVALIDGVVTAVHVRVGDRVGRDAVLLTVDPGGPDAPVDERG